MTERQRHEINAAIRKLVEAAPPLTDHQVLELRRILGTDRLPADPARDARERAERDAEWQARRVAEEAEKEISRYFTVSNDQVVEIEGRWAYRWAGEPPLTIGEHVILPSVPWRSGRPWIGRITGLGSTYDGELSYVIRRASEQDEADFS